MLEKLMEETNILSCIQCGRCSGSCPAGKKSRLLTRKLILSARLGKNVLANEELWYCTTCYTCYERCPKKVNTVDAIKKLRYLAVKNGYPHPELHKVAIENLYTTGNGVPLSDEAARYRSMLSDKSIGFERLPFDLSTNEEELKKFRSLIDELGMMSIVK